MDLSPCGGCRSGNTTVHLNQRVDYGLYFLSALTRTRVLRSTRQIAQEGGLSFSFLQKIAHHLKRAGLVQAARGKEGGYRLLRPAQKITIRDIVNALERGRKRRIARPRSIRQSGVCPQRNFCVLRSAVARIKDEAVGSYLSKRLSDFL